MLAMGAGRTLRAVIDETAETNLPQLKILSITGSVSLDGSFNRFNAGLRAADRTGGKHFLLPVPLVAESPEAKKRWCSHELYRLVHDFARLRTQPLSGLDTSRKHVRSFRMAL
jgi:DNA-binding transcriptional regulator LsrR (DeoR family)